ncbi:MAG: putative Ig domain-containing protein [Candidatus Binatia bacterium]
MKPALVRSTPSSALPAAASRRLRPLAAALRLLARRRRRTPCLTPRLRRVPYAALFALLVATRAGAEISDDAWQPSELVSAGRASFTCALDGAGKAACWGLDSTGQATPPADTLLQITAGGTHACGLRVDGSVVCWGDPRDGRLDPPVSAFRQISAGTSHACGVRTDGTIGCWGANSFGQLAAPTGTFVQVDAGADHSCALRSDGTAVCWGRSSFFGQLTPPGGTFTQISAGSSHSCGLRGDGTVACWGSNSFGESTPPPGRFRRISAGEAYTCGVRSDGSAACWGGNWFGQSTPPPGTFVEVSASVDHACAARVDGTIACWGDDTFDQSTPPVIVVGERPLSVGAEHACEVRIGGDAGCWGYDELGGATPPIGPFLQVSAGTYHSCGVRADGKLECWGDDEYGKATPPDGRFVETSVGIDHSCALRDDGAIACWGDDSVGQSTAPPGAFRHLGVGRSTGCAVRVDGTVACWGDTASGQATPPAGTFVHVSPGRTESCGVRADGTVVCWGDLATGGTPPAGQTFRQVSVGQQHACGVGGDGAVTCWGANGSGQGNVPESAFARVGSGFASTCGVRDDRTVVCWGYDEFGQAPKVCVAPAVLPDGVLRSAYRQFITVASLVPDGYAPPSPRFRVTSGGIPGLALGADGVLSGTPTTRGSYPITVVARDANGFSASRSWTVNVTGDPTPPIVVPGFVGTLGRSGWYTSNVLLTWAVSDPDSPVSVQVGCNAQNVTADTVGTIFTCQATSAGGTTTQSVTVKRDATPPLLAPVVSPNPVPVNGVATATANASDPTSGLVSVTCTPVGTSAAGSFTVSCTAFDQAGNVANADASYVVGDVTVGSIRMLAPDPGASCARGGSFRAKFRLLDGAGRPVSEAVAKALVASCRVKVGLDAASGCARYSVNRKLFKLKLRVKQTASVGAHAVVAEVTGPEGSMRNRATVTIGVR